MAGDHPQTLSIVFMVEPGPLEVQAHLLVHSLILNCQDDHRLIAYCRKARLDGLQPATRAMLDDAGVPLVPIENPFEDGYPAGNKIVVAATKRDTDWTLILDTDTFLVRSASFLSQAAEGHISLCPANRNAWTEVERTWAALYGMFDLPKPAKAWPLSSGELNYPFFNAGMILIPGQAFGATWLETSLAIDANPDIRKKRPWLDQISLPVAIERTPDHGLKPLHRRWNDTPDLPSDGTVLLHYHRPRRLLATERMHLADDVIARSPLPFDTFGDIVRVYDALGASPNAKALTSGQ